jgi:hypothetical protein
MKKIIVIFLFLSSFINLIAQEDVLRPKNKYAETDESRSTKRRIPLCIDIEGGVNYNFFTQQSNWISNPHGTVYDGLSSAEGISPNFGVLMDFSFSNILGFQFRMSYDKKFVSKSMAGSDYSYDLNSHRVDLTASLTANYFSFTPLLRINLVQDLFLTVGPSFHILLGGIETKWSPKSIDGTPLSNFQFWNIIGFTGNASSGEITLNRSNDNPISHNTVRYCLETGIGYKLNVLEHLAVVPQARLQLFANPVTTDITLPGIEISTNRMLNSLQFQLGLWYCF